MRDVSHLEQYRVGGPANAGAYGAFALFCPVFCRTLKVLAHDGRDWESAVQEPSAAELRQMPDAVRARVLKQFAGFTGVLPLPAWEHVSVSASTTPTWNEMCWVKQQFWAPDEVVVQFHPAEADYVDVHQLTLHMWRVIGLHFPIPPKVCV